MLVDHFPQAGLRLRTPRLELRLPDLEELAELGELAIAGIHPPDTMPFLTPWTRDSPDKIALGVIQHHLRSLSEWKPDNWSLKLSVFHEGTTIGIQEINAQDLALRRQVRSGSWLGKAYQGKGLGTEMRAAVLHLGFAGLDAQEAMSFAFTHNAASQAVSRKLGYVMDGTEREVVDGELVIDTRLRLTRDAWEKHRTVDVTIDGLEPCRALFGLA
jgi:RimJ/RimL family protein N-acetyltransferase